MFVECRNLLEDVCAVYELLSWILFIKNTSISIVIYNISYIIYIYKCSCPPHNNSPPGWAFANGTISLFLSLKMVGKKVLLVG